MRDGGRGRGVRIGSRNALLSFVPILQPSIAI